MTRIAICDDETRICAQLESDVTGTLTMLKVAHETDVYYTGDKFYAQVKAGEQYDLVFMDINFASQEVDGVEVGRRVRELLKNNTVEIVFISWEKNHAMRLFEIRPFNFLTKPLDKAKIEHVLRTYLEVQQHKVDEFIYKKGHDTCRAKLKNIIYLENHGRKITIYMTGGNRDEFYGSLKELYTEQLEMKDFLFIHASYVVNYDYVAVARLSEMQLEGVPKPLPISKSRQNDVRELYMSIIRRRRG